MSEDGSTSHPRVHVMAAITAFLLSLFIWSYARPDDQENLAAYNWVCLTITTVGVLASVGIGQVRNDGRMRMALMTGFLVAGVIEFSFGFLVATLPVSS